MLLMFCYWTYYLPTISWLRILMTSDDIVPNHTMTVAPFPSQHIPNTRVYERPTSKLVLSFNVSPRWSIPAMHLNVPQIHHLLYIIQRKSGAHIGTFLCIVSQQQDTTMNVHNMRTKALVRVFPWTYTTSGKGEKRGTNWQKYCLLW